MSTIKNKLENLQSRIYYGSKTTHELIGIQIKLKHVTEAQLKAAGLDMDVAALISTTAFNEIGMQIESYKTAVYFDLFKDIRYIVKHIRDQVSGFDKTRQCIVIFKAIQCFTSIQFIVREHKLTVITNMRSCNFAVNLLIDIYISYFCGKLIKSALEDVIEDRYQINDICVIMNIGSLHIIK